MDATLCSNPLSQWREERAVCVSLFLPVHQDLLFFVKVEHPPLAIDEHLKTWEKPVNAHGQLLSLPEMSRISSVYQVVQSALELLFEVR